MFNKLQSHNLRYILGEVPLIEMISAEPKILFFDSLTDESIQILLQPFVNELAKGSEERLLSQIETRIFDHLIRQSDVAMAYEEDDEENQDENSVEFDEEKSTSQSITADSDDEELFSLEDADPRAGKGDVVLPQINVNSENMSKILLEAGSKKEVGLV